jgi:MFS family permease
MNSQIIPPRFSGWIVAASSSFLILVIAGSAFYSSSVYLVPLQETFNTNRTVIAQAFAIISLLTGILMPLVGWFVDRWGTKRCLLIGLSGIAFTFFLLSRMTLLWHFYILVIVQGLFQPFAGGIPNQTIVGRWFIKKRGRAMGLIGSGIGLGGLLIPWLLGSIIEAFSFRIAYLAAALFIALVCIPITIFLIKDKPEDVGQAPDGIPFFEDKKTENVQGATFKQAIKTVSLWSLLIGSAFAHAIVGIISLHLPAMLQDNGLSLSLASAFLGFMLGLSVIGRLVIGELSDRFRPRYLFMITAAGMGCFSLLMLNPAAAVSRIVFVILFGFCMGGMTTLVPLAVQTIFGVRAFGKIYGIITMATAVAVAGGNFLGGLLHDIIGDYSLAVTVACFFGVAAAAIIIGVQPQEIFPATNKTTHKD